MWKRIPQTAFFLSFTNKIEIYVTDFITIWTCDLSGQSFLKCLKESNFTLNLRDADFINRGKELLSKLSDLKKALVELSSDGKKLNLHLVHTFGYPFHLKITLEEGTKEMFFYKVTQNLLKSIISLRRSEAAMRHLLIKKDNEIKEYKCVGGEIALRHLKTIPFDDIAHKAAHRVYEEYFGPLDFPDDLISKINPFDCKNDGVLDVKPQIKEESTSSPDTIKKEPYSQSLESGSNTGPTRIKTEPSSESMNIKIEPISEPTNIKTEPSCESIQSGSGINLTSSNEVKLETMVSPSKRKKIKLNI